MTTSSGSRSHKQLFVSSAAPVKAPQDEQLVESGEEYLYYHQHGNVEVIEVDRTRLTNDSDEVDNAAEETDEEDALGLSLPSDLELTLLCLDYLRDLRRQYQPNKVAMQVYEGIQPDYVTLACWALNKALQPRNNLTTHSPNSNDAWRAPADERDDAPDAFHLPASLADMERELLCEPTPTTDNTDNPINGNPPYEYDDNHPSNAFRFYPLAGLASGPNVRSSLSLGEIVAAGLSGLGARTRREAEHDMIQSALFEQFVNAVHAKGFFDLQEDADEDADPAQDTHNSTNTPNTPNTTNTTNTHHPKNKDSAHNKDTTDNDNQKATQLYQERYRKVVAKFRTKLAAKADAMTTGDLLAFSAADHQRRHRQRKIQMALAFMASSPSDPHTLQQFQQLQQLQPHHQLQQLQLQLNLSQDSVTPTTPAAPLQHTYYNPLDIEEAERIKNMGNTYMQRKDYVRAMEYYTQALKLAPAGPNAHVYYSNRAAALVSLKRYQDAVADSERSLALQPQYGKAHARLGLAHFLLGNYQQAVDAYTIALQFDPDNRSSRNYLEKSHKRLLAISAPGHDPATEPSQSAPTHTIQAIQTIQTTTTHNQNSAENDNSDLNSRFLVTSSSASVITTSEWDKPQNTKTPNKINHNYPHHNSSAGKHPSILPSPSSSSVSLIPTPTAASPRRSRSHLHPANNVGPADHSSSARNHRIPASNTNSATTSSTAPNTAAIDPEREAERHKSKGNALMATRDYELAWEAYSRAIEYSPNGSQSHVYYSNRAAALCYLERYQDAEQDSLRSLALLPTYGKAHARLGLSRFFLHDYRGSIEAYTQALLYDPENAASQSYLSKAKARLHLQLQQQQQSQQSQPTTTPETTPTAATPSTVTKSSSPLTTSNKSTATATTKTKTTSATLSTTGLSSPSFRTRTGVPLPSSSNATNNTNNSKTTNNTTNNSDNNSKNNVTTSTNGTSGIMAMMMMMNPTSS